MPFFEISDVATNLITKERVFAYDHEKVFEKNFFFGRCFSAYFKRRSNLSAINTERTNVKNKKLNYNQLVLNYRRMRFYPVVRDRKNSTLFNCSLGIVSKFLNKGKSFVKKKIVYLIVFSLIRKVLLFSKLDDMILVINRTPKYLQEFMSTLYTPAISIYNNPFKASQLFVESSEHTYFDFKYVQVLTSKSYGYIKMSKRGRLKRKISKRVQLSNRILD